jgi:hypothetical protein
MSSANLRSAILALSEDTGRTLNVLRHVGALERSIFLAELRSLNVARWAVCVHRLAGEPAYSGEFLAKEVEQARRLARQLATEVAA